MSLPLRISFRYLVGRKSHGAVNVITWVAMASVAVAAAAMIVVLSVFNGFAELAQQRLSLLDPEALVTLKNLQMIDDAPSLTAKLQALPQVAAAAPRIEGEGIISTENRQRPVSIIGIPENYEQVSSIDKAIIEGMRIPEKPFITAGVGVAMAMGSRAGEDNLLFLSVPRRTARINPALPIGAMVTDTVTISGIFSTQQGDADAERIYVPLEQAQRLFERTANQASAIELATSTGVSVDEMINAVKKVLPESMQVQSRMQQEQTSMRMINIEKWIAFALLLFILIMAAFNILSTMAMLVIEKRENSSILRALGAAPALIKQIFFSQGCMIAVIGGVIGIMLGVGLCWLQISTGFIEMGGDHSQMAFTAYPMALKLGDIILIALTILTLGFAAGLITRRYK